MALKAAKEAKNEIARDTAYINVEAEEEVTTYTHIDVEDQFVEWEEVISDFSNIADSWCKVERGVQSDHIVYESTLVQTATFGKQLFTARGFDDKGLHFYTGLGCYAKFKAVLTCLGGAVRTLNYYYGFNPSLTIEDQFLLTLIKLRTHPTNYELGLFFSIDEKQVSNVFITWSIFCICSGMNSAGGHRDSWFLILLLVISIASFQKQDLFLIARKCQS